MQLTALVALAGFLFVTLLAASPTLHEAFHGHDASSPTHQCAVTLLAQGQVDAAPVPIPTPEWAAIAGPSEVTHLLLARPHGLPPERGPPLPRV